MALSSPSSLARSVRADPGGDRSSRDDPCSRGSVRLHLHPSGSTSRVHPLHFPAAYRPDLRLRGPRSCTPSQGSPGPGGLARIRTRKPFPAKWQSCWYLSLGSPPIGVSSSTHLFLIIAQPLPHGISDRFCSKPRNKDLPRTRPPHLPQNVFTIVLMASNAC